MMTTAGIAAMHGDLDNVRSTLHQTVWFTLRTPSANEDLHQHHLEVIWDNGRPRIVVDSDQVVVGVTEVIGPDNLGNNISIVSRSSNRTLGHLHTGEGSSTFFHHGSRLAYRYVPSNSNSVSDVARNSLSQVARQQDAPLTRWERIKAYISQNPCSTGWSLAAVGAATLGLICLIVKVALVVVACLTPIGWICLALALVVFIIATAIKLINEAKNSADPSGDGMCLAIKGPIVIAFKVLLSPIAVLLLVIGGLLSWWTDCPLNLAARMLDFLLDAQSDAPREYHPSY